MTLSGIYAIYNVESGKVYVGSAVDIKVRWQLHLVALRREEHHNIHFQRSWSKYGADAFEWKVLIRCDVDDLLHYEQRVMDIYKEAIGWDMMYNIYKVAGSPLGYRHTAKARAKIGAAHKGRKRSPEAVEKTAAANRGRKATPEHRAKNSAAHKGRKLSPEHVANQAAAQIGRVPWNKGKKLSLGHRAKMRAAWEIRRARL